MGEARNWAKRGQVPFDTKKRAWDGSTLTILTARVGIVGIGESAARGAGFVRVLHLHMLLHGRRYFSRGRAARYHSGKEVVARGKDIVLSSSGRNVFLLVFIKA